MDHNSLAYTNWKCQYHMLSGQQHLLLKIKEDFDKEMGFKSSFKHKLFLADAMELRLHLGNEIIAIQQISKTRNKI